MRRITSEALILDVVDLHDRDRIVGLLTPSHGQKRGVARGARRKYSRFAGQLQPLAKVKVTWFERDDRDLVRILEAEVERTAQHLYEELEGILLGSYLAEHMVVFAQENEASEHLYRLLDSTLASLKKGVEPDLAARYYEIWVLRLAGIFPVPRECPGCGEPIAGVAVLTPFGEGLVCRNCADQEIAEPDAAGGDRNARLVSREVLDLLRRSGRESLERLAEAPPSERVLRDVERICAHVRRSFLGRELRSYDVMQRTLLEVGTGSLRPPLRAPS